MSELSILQAFVAAGMTPVGACAMGGNIQAESGFRSENVQDDLTPLSDMDYTKRVNLNLQDFARDGIGYGLCQWTYPTRKANLKQFAISKGVSIDDENMQVEFAIYELKNDYPKIWDYLTKTQDITAATDLICREYERPAVNNTYIRADYANRLYMKYGEELNRIFHNPQSYNSNNSSLVQAIANRNGGIMPTIKRYDDSAEVNYLANKLSDLGYQVLWDGLWACLVDYQNKMNLDVDGICGEKTWEKLLG